MSQSICGLFTPHMVAIDGFWTLRDSFQPYSGLPHRLSAWCGSFLCRRNPRHCRSVGAEQPAPVPHAGDVLTVWPSLTIMQIPSSSALRCAPSRIVFGSKERNWPPSRFYRSTGRWRCDHQHLIGFKSAYSEMRWTVWDGNLWLRALFRALPAAFTVC